MNSENKPNHFNLKFFCMPIIRRPVDSSRGFGAHLTKIMSARPKNSSRSSFPNCIVILGRKGAHLFRITSSWGLYRYTLHFSSLVYYITIKYKMAYKMAFGGSREGTRSGSIIFCKWLCIR